VGKGVRYNMLSVIVPYCKGDETRQKAVEILKEHIEKQSYKNYERSIAEEVFTSEAQVFNKSWCINKAVKRAKSDAILVLDADIQFDKNYFQKVVDFSEECPAFFQGYKNIILSKGRDNPEERIKNFQEVKAAGGAWFVDRNFFWEVGGMNESYFGYGAEDQDFWTRAEFMLGEVRSVDADIIHTYHHWHPPNSNFPLNPNRVKFFDRTLEDPLRTINTLKLLELGNKYFPQRIYV
jgi:predicted glycosyltransferase involved in capsule biosynthesis